MWIIGLTGALGAGKSTFLEQFQKLGAPVQCADKEIHNILHVKAVQKQIKTLFPEAFDHGNFYKARLRDCVLESNARLEALEAVLYPELAQRQKDFLKKQFLKNAPIVVLDIPLLIEVGLYRYCHFVVVIETPFELRRNRVLHRKGMSIEKFKKLESNQVSEDVRRKFADVIVQTGRTKTGLLKKAKEILSLLSENPSPTWSGEWPDTFKKELYVKRDRSRHRNNRI